MPVATRLLVAFVLLVGAFAVLVGVAVFSLYTVGQPMLAGVVAAAGLAGLLAGGVTYWFLRGEDEEQEPGIPEESPVAVALPVAGFMPASRPRRLPLRVSAMPVAKLPPAYVDAVMRGLKAQGRRDH